MSGKVFNEKCVITGEPARYRDPITGQPYATLAAFKILRERFTEQGGVVPTPEEIAAKAKAESLQKGEEQARQRDEAEARESEGDVRLTSAQLESLDTCQEVKVLLKDCEISRMVREIDASSDPHKALMAARSQPQMAELMARILSAVGEEPMPDDAV